MSELAKSLDEHVKAFRSRPLEANAYPYVWLDALAVKSREGGRIANVAVVLATAVNDDGHREVLGVDVFTMEDGAAWTAFLRDLVARSLNEVKLVVSDAHQGLKAAIGATLPGASWQRCRTHFMRNLLTQVPRSAQGFVATIVRSISQARLTIQRPTRLPTWCAPARARTGNGRVRGRAAFTRGRLPQSAR